MENLENESKSGLTCQAMLEKSIPVVRLELKLPGKLEKGNRWRG